MTKLSRELKDNLFSIRNKTNLKIHLPWFIYTYAFPEVANLKDLIFNLEFNEQFQIFQLMLHF